MTLQFDLSKRYASAFGLLASGALPSAATLSREGSTYNLELYQPIAPDYEHIRFTYGQTVVNFASIPFTKEIPNILAPPPLIRFSRQKQLIETPVNDSDHVVVERWGTRAWDIRLQGLLIDVENRHYPQQKIRELSRLFEYNGVIDVSGTQFYDKDIHSLYLKSVEISGVPGYQDTVQFSMQATSSNPVGFTLVNPTL